MVACAFFCLISDFIYVMCMQFINKRSINAAKSMHYRLSQCPMFRCTIRNAIQYLSRCSFFSFIYLTLIFAVFSLNFYMLVSWLFSSLVTKQWRNIHFSLSWAKAESKKKIIKQIKNKCSRCVNKNLERIKYCTLHETNCIWLWRRRCEVSVCLEWSGAEEFRDFGVVLVIIIILLLHACRCMWVI